VTCLVDSFFCDFFFLPKSKVKVNTIILTYHELAALCKYFPEKENNGHINSIFVLFFRSETCFFSDCKERKLRNNIPK